MRTIRIALLLHRSTVNMYPASSLLRNNLSRFLPIMNWNLVYLQLRRIACSLLLFFNKNNLIND